MSNRKNKPVIELEIESIGFEGVAVAKLEGKVHFVKGAIPGDLVKVQIKKNKKSYVECHLLEVITPSEKRITARCEHFGTCGGCSWQNLGYADQLYWKKTHVIDALKRLGKIEDVIVHNVMPSAQEFNYRNKMDFSFSASRWLSEDEIKAETDIEDKTFAFGLHIPGRYDKVLNINTCHIQSEFGNRLIKSTRNLTTKFALDCYNTHTHEGFLRSLIVRNSIKKNENMAILVTNKITNDSQIEFIKEFTAAAKADGATSIFHAINWTVNPVQVNEITLLDGADHIMDEILGINYKISPFSFFQTNSTQLDSFISHILDYADLQKQDIVWDLYCGTGSITLPASRKVDSIYGIELNEGSIEDAKSNATLNNIGNTNFFAANLHDKNIPVLLTTLPKPNKIIVDPPRAGMAENLIRHLLELEAEHIVYVSCNPATQARDLQLLSEKYRTIEVQPVDMFPHTFHIESIAKLELIKA